MKKLVQLSAGQGPSECCLAVAKAYELFVKEAEKRNLTLQMLEKEAGRENGTYKSILLSIECSDKDQAAEFQARWDGAMQWTCKSPFRTNHGRKNWFFDVSWWPEPAENAVDLKQCVIKSCRSSGAGGQHVNTTDSAIQITHIPTGTTVRMESERSQHQNKRLALVLLSHKLRQTNDAKKAEVKGELRMQHHQLQRGQPQRSFVGLEFKEK
jgi:peptide chain release factor